MSNVVRLRASEPTWLYRLYCLHGGLLYVGITRDVQDRLAAHRRTQPWWHEVARVLAYQFSSREAARAAELAAITYDAPLHNVEGVVPNHQYAANRWAQEFGTAYLPTWTWESEALEAHN